jgi:hypothetical protein
MNTITITSVSVRPSTDVVWFFEHEISAGNSFYQNYIKETLIDANLLKQSRSYSDNGLVMTTVNELTDEGFNIWFNDPVIITARDEMLVYNTQNNIILNSIEIT